MHDSLYLKMFHHIHKLGEHDPYDTLAQLIVTFLDQLVQIASLRYFKHEVQVRLVLWKVT